jgi:lysophospholipase L1-like esterase
MRAGEANQPITPLRQATTRGVVVACLGSSTTAAKGTFNWISVLEQRPHNQQFRFLNFGVGGDLAYNTLQRVPGVAACQPDIVLILIGGNDILALVFENVRRLFRRWKRLPNDPSPQ